MMTDKKGVTNPELKDLRQELQPLYVANTLDGFGLYLYVARIVFFSFARTERSDVD